MSSVAYEEVQRRFFDALELPDLLRGRAVEQARSECQELGLELESLLHSHDRLPSGFLAESGLDLGTWTGAAAPEPRDRLELERVGPYRVLRHIATGGMASVFLAERDDGAWEQRVAVKVFSPSDPESDLAGRLVVERQILARLTHPHIAHLLDGGTTAAGRPYLVMDFVDGHSILEASDRRSLSIRQRLELFCKVCEAVHFAHQNLVVHRDLKPGNILVGEDGEPKLLDFGIAKVLAPGDFPGPVERTRAGGCLMTPAYASPEQIKNEAISTASDIYSLGVVLHELLTGARPYRVERGPALLHAICYEHATAPSKSVGAHESRRRRALAGDLDGIVLKALRKDPRKRYTSAAQLADDLRRYLHGLPVLARESTALYRLNKFVRRHRELTAAAAVFVPLLASLAWQNIRARERAEAEAATSAAITDFVVETFAAPNPILGLGRDVTVLEMLERAEGSLDQRFSSEPELLAATQEVVGSTFLALGRFDRAVELLESALALRRAGAGEVDAELLYSYGASLLNVGRYDEAERTLDEGLHRWQRGPEQDENLHLTLRLRMAHLLQGQGRLVEAEAHLERALASPLRQRDVRVGARVYGYYAGLLSAKGEHAQAALAYREGLRLVKSHPQPNPHRIGELEAFLGSTLTELGQYDEADDALRRALAIALELFGEVSPSVVRELRFLGRLELRRGDPAASTRVLRTSAAAGASRVR